MNNTLTVSHCLVNVHTLGPGNRLGIWFTGCSKHCPSCCAQKLKNADFGIKTDAKTLALTIKSAIAKYKLNGITISGGDPLEQNSKAFSEFLKFLECDDILLYTGYTYGEVKKLPIFDAVKNYVGVLKCGRYNKDKDNNNVLLGSSNQELIFLKEEYRKSYEDYIKISPRKPEWCTSSDTIYLAGLPINNKE